MDIKQLKYFVTVSDYRSIQNAAHYLYVSPSTLSKSLKALEDELNVKLIYFQEKKMSLTSSGKELYNLAKNILIQYDNITPTISNLHTAKTGILRIGLPPIIGTCVFPEIISGFVKKYPGIELVISQYVATDVQKMLTSNLIDCGFTLSPITEDCNSISILNSCYTVVMNKENRLSKFDSISLNDLKDQKLLLLSTKYKFYDEIYSAFEEAGIMPNILMHLSDWDLVLRLVDLNIGVGILPKPIVDLYKTSQTVDIPLSGPHFKYDILFISNEKQFESSAMKAFKEHMFSIVNS
ncbi:MAG: LysR family transcriptional regulator [Eubacteriales bacterium]|nr:LysR family transcriptional regulator [Eubacteriales bacterium]